MIREKRAGSGLERLNYDTQHDAKEREMLSGPVDEQMDITFSIQQKFNEIQRSLFSYKLYCKH